MIALEIAFPAGRFHATPWDRAVNEGEVEWPPSPWRLLRALIAGFLNVNGDLDELTGVLDRLAEAPRYVLPPAVASHTRHYMPGESATKTLVLDAFVAVERSARAYVVWDDVKLEADDEHILRRACAGISYLGRAESWCEVRVVPAVIDDVDHIAVGLASRATTAGPSARRLGVAADVRGIGLLQALLLPTSAMRHQRRLQPPGSTWLEYRFPPGFGLQGSEESRANRARSAILPPNSGLRFVLEGRNSALRPAVTDTLAVAEAFRGAMMRCYSSLTGETVPPELSGKRDEQPLSGHEHAFILPRDLDHDGKVDHVDVWFRSGTSQQTFRAVRSVQKLWDPRLSKDECFSVTHLGGVPRESARVWRSATPFLLGAHARDTGSAARRARYTPEAQLERSLLEHGHPRPTSMQAWPSPAIIEHERGGATLLAAFRSARKRDHVIGVPLGFTIDFETDVEGPIAVGRYAHFGLGQFVPDI